MATAILDVDLQEPPQQMTGLDRYQRALVLVRWRGRPVGQVALPVIEGTIGGARLREALMNAAEVVVRERWLYEYLGWEEVRQQTHSVTPTATVAVCTRDRTEDLRRCLDALMRMPDDGQQEFIVVDNSPSTDATRLLVRAYDRVHYVREDRRGLNAARNRALREARHEVVAFIDDDAVPDPAWLRALLLNFDDPLVLCVTGLTMTLELETEAQEWSERYSPFGRGFQRRVFESGQINPLAVGRVGAGVNMALRRSAVEQVGFFDEALDAGTPARSGGDNEMFTRILLAGYRIVYEPAALNWHRHRRTWEELRAAIYGYGVGVYAAWTRSPLVEGELSALKVAFN